MSHPPHYLLPETLPANVIVALSGRSRKAVFDAKASGRLRSFATAHVEQWLGQEICPLTYLKACRATDAERARRRTQ